MGHIYTEFARVDEHRNSNVEGTGLGLSITKSLCRAMGGDITARSDYGKGSVFIATVIQTVNNWAPMGGVAAVPGARPGARYVTFVAPTAEVLVVDDFPANLIVANGLLAPYNVSVFDAPNGLDALKLAQDRHFDLILMDHMMPVMDGVEATAAIRAHGGRLAELPIVALTANAVLGMEEFYLNSGFSSYLTKPIDPSRLDAVLKKWIPKEKQCGLAEINDVKSVSEDNAIPRIHGVDTVTGLAMVGGSTKSYCELLRVFFQDTESRLDMLEFINDEDKLKPFITFVHGLKCALANIGAKKLSEAAANLESAGRDGDIYAIQGGVYQFREGLAALLEHIRQAMPNLLENTGDDVETDDAGLYTCLMELHPALDAFDTDGMDKALNKLKTLKLATEAKAKVADIADHILVGDFEAASEATNSLLSVLPSRPK